MGKPIAAAAPAAKSKSETVSEFVLYRRVGDDRVPVMSDHDLDVVNQTKIMTVAHALSNGQARPDLFITERTCTFPLNGAGKRQAEGSTCYETEV